MAVLYPSFFSFTVTRTKATREPSGEICVSPAQTKLNKSFSVMFRLWAKAGTASRAMEIKMNKRRDRIEVPFRIRVSNAAAFYRELAKRGTAGTSRSTGPLSPIERADDLAGDIHPPRHVMNDERLSGQLRVLNLAAAVQGHAMPEKHITLLCQKQLTLVLTGQSLDVFMIFPANLSAGSSQIGLRIGIELVEERL